MGFITRVPFCARSGRNTDYDEDHNGLVGTMITNDSTAAHRYERFDIMQSRERAKI